ncbi:TonB-dependent siderophore receptor [Alicycliphilus denitrificans BC]|nr:TonB-dependent siderophore receptor [Alicycliphilus denitrificans BC]
MPHCTPSRASSAPAPVLGACAVAIQVMLGSASLSGAVPAAAQSAGGGTAAALPEVTVTQRREAIDEAPPAYAGGQVGSGARLGILGNAPVLDTPFSVTSYTAQAIENEQARSVADVIAMDPSVRMASARSNINEDITIRGFAVPSGDFALNGMFGLTPYWRAPLEAVERVEVLKGPSAALFGMAPGGSVGGVVNLVSKRAGAQPLTRFTAGVMSDSVAGGHLDVGRRFGPDGALGARVNLMRRQGDTNIDHQSTRESLASLGLDLRQSALRASLDLLWQEQRIDNVVRQFQLAPGLAAIPRAPDNSIAYPGYGWTDGHDGSALFKAEYDINDTLTAYAGLGQRKLNWGSMAGNPVILNTAGDYSYFGGWQRMGVDSKSAEAGVRASFRTGGMAHNAALAFTRLDQDQTLGFYTGFPGGMSNLYAGGRQPTPSIAGIDNPLRPYQDSKLTSVALADTVTLLEDRLLVTLGLRHQKVQGQSYNYMTGAASGPYYDKSATTPLAGVVFKLRPNWSLYASYVEGLSRGETAPVSAAIANPGEAMPPYRSKQKEIGAKFDHGGFLATVGLFELTRPSAAVSGNVFGVNGEQRNRGLEASVAGEVARGLRLLGGASFMDAELSRSANAALVGKRAIGVPRSQLNLGAEWDAGFAPGLTLTGRMVHTAKTYADAANTLRVAGWTRWDAGARYATRIGGKPVTFRLNVENLLDKNYYGIATAGYLFLGSPRTVSLSASVDL